MNKNKLNKKYDTFKKVMDRMDYIRLYAIEDIELNGKRNTNGELNGNVISKIEKLLDELNYLESYSSTFEKEEIEKYYKE